MGRLFSPLLLLVLGFRSLLCPLSLSAGGMFSPSLSGELSPLTECCPFSLLLIAAGVDVAPALVPCSAALEEKRPK